MRAPPKTHFFDVMRNEEQKNVGMEEVGNGGAGVGVGEQKIIRRYAKKEDKMNQVEGVEEADVGIVSCWSQLNSNNSKEALD